MWFHKELIEERDRLRNELKYERLTRKMWNDIARDSCSDRDNLKVELVSTSIKLQAADFQSAHLYDVIRNNHSRIWQLQNDVITHDKEIALLKYQLANPTFGSTETPELEYQLLNPLFALPKSAAAITRKK